MGKIKSNFCYQKFTNCPKLHVQFEFEYNLKFENFHHPSTYSKMTTSKPQDADFSPSAPSALRRAADTTAHSSPKESFGNQLKPFGSPAGDHLLLGTPTPRLVICFTADDMIGKPVGIIFSATRARIIWIIWVRTIYAIICVCHGYH